MPKPNQIYDNDPTCPVSSNSFYDEYGNIIDDTHIHDNRYYTKAQTDGLIDSKLASFEFAPLTEGLGVAEFMYNGTTATRISLDYESLSEIYFGTSSKPARSDHYHKNLTAGFGVRYFIYNGSDDALLNLNFDSNGASNYVSRADHIHKLLSNGAGIRSLSYDGAATAQIILDYMSDGNAKYGSSDKPARSDHSHELLKTGNGFIYLEYTGSEEGILTIDYEGFSGDWGERTSIARSDHIHDTIYYQKSEINTSWVTNITPNAKTLQLRNKNNAVINTITVPFATTAGKWDSAITFNLAGDVVASGFIDGSGNITLQTKIMSITGNLDLGTVEVIKRYAKDAFKEVSSSTIAITEDQAAVLSAEVLSAPKWTTARTITLTGAITGSGLIDGSSNISILTEGETDLSSPATQNNIKDIVSEMFTGIKDGLSINYNSRKQLDFSISSKYFSNDKDAIPLTDIEISLGSETKRFYLGYISELFVTELTATGECTVAKLNTRELDVADAVIRLNANETGNGMSSAQGGISLSRGTANDALLVFNEADDSWYHGISGKLYKIPKAGVAISGTAQLNSSTTTLQIDTLYVAKSLTQNLSVNLPENNAIEIGSQIVVKNISNYTVSIAPGSSATIDGESAAIELLIKGSSVTLIRDDNRSWVVV